MSHNFIYFVALFIIGGMRSPSDALQCYSCIYVAPSSEKACVKNPDGVSGQKIINCSKKYCIIQRKELVNYPGFVSTFQRGCEDKPLILNDVIKDSTFKTYYRSCTTDFCNSGDGIASSNIASDPDAGAGDNMIVKGISGGISVVSKLNMSFLFMFVSLALLI